MANKIKIMAHLIDNYPDQKYFLAAAKGLKDGGADILELQIPFSDPTADGPVITAACEKTIEQGYRVKNFFNNLRKIKKLSFSEIIVMTYANIAFKYGIEKFIKDLKKNGGAGVIVPDLPLEDEEGFYQLAAKYNLAAIPVAAPNMSEERIKLLKSKQATKVYIALRTGTTGSETVIDNPTKNFLNKFKELEIMAGFGINNKKQIAQLAAVADIAVVGSHFTKIITASAKEDIYNNIKNAVGKLR